MHATLPSGKLEIRYRQPTDPFFYYFDYDVRSYSVNMDFQHFHTFYELFILLDEEAFHTIEGQLYRLQRHDIVCLRPALLHKSHYPMGKPKRRLVINFQFSEELGNLLSEHHRLLDVFDEHLPIFRFNQQDTSAILDPLIKLLNTHNESGPLSGVQLHYGFVQALMKLNECRSHNSFQAISWQSSLTDKIYDICAYIHAHYAEDLSLDGLARQFYISPSYLSRQFKLVTHFGLTEYIQRTRIRNAQQLLIFTDDKVADIARCCGFGSFSQFSRVFQNVCACTPISYRKMNRQLKAKAR